MSTVHYNMGSLYTPVYIKVNSVLARNEEFSKICSYQIFFYSSQKKNTVICGGILRGKFRDIPRKSTV